MIRRIPLPWHEADWFDLTEAQRDERMARFRREIDQAASRIRYGAAEVIPFPTKKKAIR